MGTFKSYGVKAPTPAERNFSLIKSAVFFVVMVGLAITAFIIFNPNSDVGTTDAEGEQCVNVIPNSVFTTGDPLTDERILYTIVNDETEGNEASGDLVTHLWDNENFDFEGKSAELWEEAVENVNELEDIEEPALAMTDDEVIIPYEEPEELQGTEWTEVETSTPRDTKSMGLMVSSQGEETTDPAPIVILSLTGNNTIPSPTMGDDSEHQAVEMNRVCDSDEQE